MSRLVSLIDFDGSIIDDKTVCLPEPPPPEFGIVKKLDDKIWTAKEILETWIKNPDDERFAVIRYTLVYEGSDRVFYGRFE